MLEFRLTHRKHASSVVFVTGHEDPEKKNEIVKWKKLAKSVDTIVIMMGLSRIDMICKQLMWLEEWIKNSCGCNSKWNYSQTKND